MRPIQLKKELPGHVVNRLQGALYREIVSLIEQDILDVSDADDAVSWGPGLRWGVMGPSLLWHLSSGPGGIEAFMGKFMDAMVATWPALGEPTVTPELKQKIITGVLDEAAGRSVAELSTERDAMLISLLATRASQGQSRSRDLSTR
jgi:3-hydroxyacyl-CoA dehydrogenase